MKQKTLLALLIASLSGIYSASANPVTLGACTVEVPGGWSIVSQSDSRLLAKGTKEKQGCSVLVEPVPGITAADPNDPKTQSDILSDLRQDGDHVLDTKVIPINGIPALVVLAHKLDEAKKLSLVMEVFFTPGKNYYVSVTSYDNDPRDDPAIKAYLNSPSFK